MIFISDIHLNIKNPITIKKFLKFLKYSLNNIKSLYILGDLFDVWIGDDYKNILYKKIAHELFSLKNRGISCYFIPGNHDFLIGKYYAKSCGMILLPEKKIINFLNKKIIILHGDSLCINDYSYKIFRYIIRSKFLKNIFLRLPLYLRLKIFKKIQNKSNLKKKYKFNIKINEKKILKIFNETNFDIMIHGHIHQKNIFILKNKNKIFYRAVLGSWENNGSAIYITKSKIKLINFLF
ncbi:UDP-2,3-diacylglucosamine diphosphatase [Sodalis-like secondary symbiont of Drepanosiphum platanoidis]|uniref:UDP-2,3-diacylglucosamine diphosphatase n=1 Tax=Sodalis-like secondary symbiont of Drepanosiphum platanoidis TaxID=2994493 RepID=UPI00346393DE